jgi:hypothetical protein
MALSGAAGALLTPGGAIFARAGSGGWATTAAGNTATVAGLAGAWLSGAGASTVAGTRTGSAADCWRHHSAAPANIAKAISSGKTHWAECLSKAISGFRWVAAAPGANRLVVPRRC